MKGLPVTVVGAGPVGAALALLLARRGCAVDLVDARPPAHRPGPSGYEARTLAISPASRELLLDLDAWPDGAAAYRAMHVWDAAGAELGFSVDDSGAEALGWIVEHGRLATTLWAALAAEPGITLHAPARVTRLEPAGGGQWQPIVEDADGHSSRLRPALVVAADGADSALRRMAGLDTTDWETGHAALATVVATAQPHGDTAWQRFLPEGPLALLPLPDRDGRHWVSVVWSQPPEEAQRRVALEPSAFAAELEVASECRLGSIAAADPRIAFPLRQRHAETYHSGNLVLVGDAAHVVHPMAGQGMNLGFRDVRALLDALDSAGGVRLNGAVLHGVLGRYQRRRAADNLGMLAALAGLQGLFGAEDPAWQRLRGRGLAMVAATPALRRRFMEEAMA